MKKFLILYNAPLNELDKMMEQMKGNPEAMKEGMDSWMNWMNGMKDNFVDMGAPAAKNKRVTAQGIEDVRNEVTGYSILQANSLEEAAELINRDPKSPHFHIPGAYVEVTELMEMPQM